MMFHQKSYLHLAVLLLVLGLFSCSAPKLYNSNRELLTPWLPSW